jgi:hypothetical protein
VERGGKHAVVNKLVTHLTAPKVDARESDMSFRPFTRGGGGRSSGGGGGRGGGDGAGIGVHDESSGGASAPAPHQNQQHDDGDASHPVSRPEPVLIEADEASAKRLRHDDVFEVEDDATMLDVQRDGASSSAGAGAASAASKQGHGGNGKHHRASSPSPSHHHHGSNHDHHAAAPRHHRGGSGAGGSKEGRQQQQKQEGHEGEGEVGGSSPGGGDGEESVGFFFQMAHEPKASLEVVKQVRKHFPNAPLSVVSDAGWDCAGMCEKYGCDFRRAAKVGSARYFAVKTHSTDHSQYSPCNQSDTPRE